MGSTPTPGTIYIQMKELIKYVKEAREAGLKEYFIRQALIDAGWERDTIDEAMDSEESWPEKGRIDLTASKEDIKPPKKKRPIKITPFLKILAIATALALGATWLISALPKGNFQLNFPNFDQGDEFQYGSWPALEDADFFSQVKEQFIEEKTSFIESDLSQMTLRVYKNGRLEEEVPIVSKGREGSWWETPAGLYKVQGKEDNHFSSFGQVYMPWSMPFQGNFFIHGWPYYPSGEEVAQGYSGGCIRLSTDNAKKVYDLVEVGMPILVYEEDFLGDDFSYELLGDQVGANNYLAADLKNNFVFAELNSNVKVPIASLTKLMTALIATEYINIERETTITAGMLTQTSIPRLQVGQQVSVFDLLYPLLMESSNEAGTAIASILGQGRFVQLMNEKATAIGMRNTHFEDPNGISAENVSTAQDLFQLAKYLYNNRSFVLDISKGGARSSVYGAPVWGYSLQNFNVFVEDSGFIGGKVGMTNAAGETILSIFEVETDGEIRPVVVIALGSKNRAQDGTALINHIRTSY